MKYTVKQVGDPNNMGGEREIIVYKIYGNGKQIGYARYRPSLYKSKYMLEMDVFKMPKSASDWYKDQGQEYRGKGYSGKPKSILPAGDSAKNPTAVLRQFKSRWESRIKALQERRKASKKATSKFKKSGLSSSDYEKLGKYQAYIKNYQDSIKKDKRSIMYAKDSIKRSNEWIKEFKSRIAKLKKK
jgi:hypothetical protein